MNGDVVARHWTSPKSPPKRNCLLFHCSSKIMTTKNLQRIKMPGWLTSPATPPDIEPVAVEPIIASTSVPFRHPIAGLHRSTRGIRIAVAGSPDPPSQLHRLELQRERPLPTRLNRKRPEQALAPSPSQVLNSYNLRLIVRLRQAADVIGAGPAAL